MPRFRVRVLPVTSRSPAAAETNRQCVRRQLLHCECRPAKAAGRYRGPSRLLKAFPNVSKDKAFSYVCSSSLFSHVGTAKVTLYFIFIEVPRVLADNTSKLWKV